MGLGVVRRQRDVRTTEYHADASFSKLGGERIRAHRCTRDHRHAQEVDIEVRIDFRDALVYADYFGV
ncbi:MAG TPA: hypothetical protein VMS30_09340 [Phycisphaerales bacterium]|nr:hypothetical protein [Phycisphaerales bacterium]